MNDKKFVEYKCSYCGATITRATNAGRPMPGVCPRKGKTRDGRTKPHTRVIMYKKISAIALIIIGIMSLRTSLFGAAFCILLGIFLLTH